jgi:hypothetical protein
MRQSARRENTKSEIDADPPNTRVPDDTHAACTCTGVAGRLGTPLAPSGTARCTLFHHFSFFSPEAPSLRAAESAPCPPSDPSTEALPVPARISDPPSETEGGKDDRALANVSWELALLLLLLHALLTLASSPPPPAAAPPLESASVPASPRSTLTSCSATEGEPLVSGSPSASTYRTNGLLSSPPRSLPWLPPPLPPSLPPPRTTTTGLNTASMSVSVVLGQYASGRRFTSNGIPGVA